jgi:hypothetical protein
MHKENMSQSKENYTLVLIKFEPMQRKYESVQKNRWRGYMGYCIKNEFSEDEALKCMEKL